MKKKNLNLSFNDVVKRFELIEKELKLDKSFVQNVPWWDMVRYPIFQALKLELKFETIKKKKISTKKKFFYFFNKFLNYFKFLSFKSPFWINKNSYIILSHPRRIYENGKFVDPYVDPFIELFSNSTQFAVIENEFNGKHLKPPKTKNLFYVEKLSFLEFLLSIFFIEKFDKKTTSIFSKVEKEIFKYFRCHIDVKKRAKLKIRKWKVVYPLMTFFFKIKKPELLFVVNSNGHEPIIAAAKSLGISSVELQHGSPVRGKLNYDYSSGIEKSSFPDWFLSYGGFWQSTIRYPIKNKKIINFGNPYLFSKISSYSHVKKEERLVIISQTNYSTELSKFAFQARNHISKNIIIEFKPHPYEYEINDFKEMKRYSGGTLPSFGKNGVKSQCLAVAYH